jgi:DNA modification methylase
MLYNADCLDVLRDMPECFSVDAVITDPPFGIGNFVQKSGRIMGRGKNRGKAVTWNESAPPDEFFQIVKRISNHRIIWGANYFNCFEDRGGAIVWIKNQKMPNFSKADIASCTHFQKTETVTIPWNNWIAAHDAQTDHPCERPVSLYQWCIQYLPHIPHSVMDPYMGSGSCGCAAVRCGAPFIGIELDADYFEAAKKRIVAAMGQTVPLEDKDAPLFAEHPAGRE